MYDTYCRIFKRCGLDYRVVEADSGNIGGAISHEFMVVADSGEDAIAHCPNCHYSANIEAATSLLQESSNLVAKTEQDKLGELKLTKVDTPNIRTIDELTKFFKTDSSSFIKTLIYVADDKPVAVLLRGDTQLNELKLKKTLNATDLFLADEETILKVTGAAVGFAGPVNLKNIPIIADHQIAKMTSSIAGANETDFHLINVVPTRDFNLGQVADLRQVSAGETCPKCKTGSLQIDRGIEVGHIFQLGTKYSTKMSAVYSEESGEQKPFIMGCYGIGVGRTAAAAIEQHNDANGIIWPLTLAPFTVALIITNIDDPQQKEIAENLYQTLLDNKIEVLLDDRNERAGVKFKDADLIGIPLKVILGKSLKDDKIEIKQRTSSEAKLVSVDEVMEEIRKAIL